MQSVHCTDTYTVLGGSQTQRMFHRGIVNFAVCGGDDDNGDDDDDRLQSPPKDELIVGSTSMVVEVPRGCKRDEKHLLQLNTGMTKPTISLVTSMAWIA